MFCSTVCCIIQSNCFLYCLIGITVHCQWHWNRTLSLERFFSMKPHKRGKNTSDVNVNVDAVNAVHQFQNDFSFRKTKNDSIFCSFVSSGSIFLRSTSCRRMKSKSAKKTSRGNSLSALVEDLST